MKKGILLLIGFSLLISCQLRVDKRLYNKGYFVQAHGKKKSSAVNEEHINTNSALPGIMNAITPEQEENVVQASEEFKTIADLNSVSVVNPAAEVIPGVSENGNKTEDAIIVEEEGDNVVVAERGADNGQKENADAGLYALAALLGAGVFALIRVNRERVLKATRWANNNKIKSKMFIFIIQAAICVLGISSGRLFHDSGMSFSNNMEYIFGACMSLGFLYLVVNGARKKTPVFSSFYLKKASHLLIGLCLLGASAGIGNRMADHREQVTPLGHAIEKAEKLLSTTPHNAIGLNAESPAPKLGSKGLAALYIFLAFLLLLVLTVLTCAVGCSVGAGAAVIVGIICAAVMAAVIVEMVKSVKRRKAEQSVPTGG